MTHASFCTFNLKEYIFGKKSAKGSFLDVNPYNKPEWREKHMAAAYNLLVAVPVPTMKDGYDYGVVARHRCEVASGGIDLWYPKGPEFVWPWDQLNNKAISNTPPVQAESESDSDPSQQYLTSEEVDRVIEGCMSTIRTATTNKTPRDNSAKKDFFIRLTNGLQSKLLEELWGSDSKRKTKKKAKRPTKGQRWAKKHEKRDAAKDKKKRDKKKDKNTREK
ncbi:hypothetical protein N0V85_004836 [Neurospora sp. IMI 360204]|nr:hypothetical protein N0V85_004836 [Neurospora sp. IMI 360204]